MPAVSGRQLADALSISEGMIRKHKKPGGALHGALLDDGTFDLDKAVAAYATKVDPAKQRMPAPSPAAPAAAPVQAAAASTPTAPTLEKGAVDYHRARAALVAENALLVQVKRKKAQGSVIERDKTLALVQTLARQFRDGLLGFTDRHYSQIAAELGVDAHLVYQVLDRHLLQYLEKSVDSIEVAL